MRMGKNGDSESNEPLLNRCVEIENPVGSDQHEKEDLRADEIVNNPRDSSNSAYLSHKRFGTQLKMAASKISSLTILRYLVHLLLRAAYRFWGVCTTGILILLLIYYLYGGLLPILLLLTSVIGLLYHLQDKLLYYPEQPPTSRLFVESPATMNLPFENIFVKTSDGVTINLVLVKQPPQNISNAHTVIYFHGNAGNIGHRLINALTFHQQSGMNVLLVEYRGYGKSQGSPSESGLYLDAQAAMEYITTRRDINQSKLVVFGRSLGGAVAIELAGSSLYKGRISACIIENTFSSLPDIGRHIFDVKLVTILPYICFKNKYPSNKRVPKLSVPVLFLSGLSDNLVPPRMMRDLYQACGSGLKRMAVFEEGTHNETWQCPGYHETINRFLQEVDKYRKSGETAASATYNVQVPFDDGGTGVFDV